MSAYFHGGKAGLMCGEKLTPSESHIVDGCPVCTARAAGHTITVGEYRQWAEAMGYTALIEELADADPAAPVDPPSAQKGVYVTSSLEYATFYAARSRGDLYRVTPLGRLVPSAEDHFAPSWVAKEAVVAEVLRRCVVLTRAERRHIKRLWQKADKKALTR